MLVANVGRARAGQGEVRLQRGGARAGGPAGRGLLPSPSTPWTVPPSWTPTSPSAPSLASGPGTSSRASLGATRCATFKCLRLQTPGTTLTFADHCSFSPEIEVAARTP